MLHPLQEHNDEINQRGLSRLATLLEHADPVELYVATATSVMFAAPETLTQANSDTASVKIERLAYELYPHFRQSRASTERESVESTTLRTGDIQLCHEILTDLLFSHMFQAFRPAEEEDDLIASIRGRATIVRGNAYPPQTERRIREVQGRFDHWYAQNIGIAPSRAVDALHAIVRDQENAFNGLVRPAAAETADLFESKWQMIRKKHKHRRDAEESTFIQQFQTRAAARIAGFALASGHASFLHIPARCPALEPALTNVEWNSLLSLIGLTAQERDKMRAPVEVRNRPLYVLPDGRVLFVNLSNVLDALWEAFDFAARQDQTFYDTRYQRYAADWLEERIIIYLRRLFPDGAIYKTLDYPDSERHQVRSQNSMLPSYGGHLFFLLRPKQNSFVLLGNSAMLVGSVRT
jgi:hypothetical protein